MHDFFSFLNRQENIAYAITLLAAYTVVCGLGGAAIGIMLCAKADKKIPKRDNYYFDDGSQLPMRIVKRKQIKK